MKKTFKMIGMACLVGAFAFVGSSCKKNNTDTTSIKANMPALEENYIDGDRAYIDFNDGNKMKWSEGDQIAIYNLAENYTQSVRNIYTLISGANTTEGHFSGGVMGDLNEGFDGYYAFYPASMVVNHPIGPLNSQTFDIPATQNYHYNCMDPTSLVMAVKGELIMDHFRMKHIFGFADFKLKGTKKVKRIVVTDNQFPLNGDVTIDIPGVTYLFYDRLKNRILELADYHYDYSMTMLLLNTMLQNELLIYTSNPGDHTMTLECGNGVQLNPNTYTKFIMTLRPVALCQGFSVTVYYTDNTSETFNKFNPNHADYGYASNQALPRAFCTKPGTINHFSLN